MSPEISFRSISEEYLGTTIDGSEFFREIHDMNCTDSEEALLFAKKFERNPLSEMTWSENDHLRRTSIGKVFLARHGFAQGNFKLAIGLLKEAIEQTQDPIYKFELYVVYVTKMRLDVLESRVGHRAIAQNRSNVKHARSALMGLENNWPHMGAIFLQEMISSAQLNPLDEAPFPSVESVIKALEACSVYNTEFLSHAYRSFRLNNMKEVIKRSLKDPLQPHPEVLAVPSAESVTPLVLDLLGAFYREELQLSLEQQERLIEVYRSLEGKPMATTGEIRRRVFSAGQADLIRSRVLKAALNRI